ncbi:MAG: PQQ-binding-like beta-propeller repeat protein [Candidatus Bathyarchaeota archaeon]|nr:PQQ-binding-like beta-propeller repeat protein [Candidatus Bathyarchaeota archaeon]
MTVSVFALPNTIAQEDPPSRPSYVYLGVINNPIGVNQELLLHIGSPHALQSVQMGWEGITVTVTWPDGHNSTLGPYKTDSTGGTGGVFIPTEAGNYTLQAHFPEQVTTSSKVGQSMTAGTIVREGYSPPVILVVTEEPIPLYPGHPLPSEYWSRPIDAQLREWNTMGGSWLVATPDNKFVPYNSAAPDSAHILWTQPLTVGGIAGGETGDDAFSSGDAYEGKWTSRFVVSGVVIYTHHTSARPLEYSAYNIHTGEHLWTTTFLDNRSITMGQVLRWEGYNHHGVYSYLWVSVGTTWYAYDPLTAQWVFTINNVPAGTTVVDENGWIYRYQYTANQNLLRIWNMTALGTMSGSGYQQGGGWGTGILYKTLDAGGWTGNTTAQKTSYINITTPTGTLPGSITAFWMNDRVVGAQIASDRSAVRLWAFSLEPGTEGRLLYNTTWTPPKSWAEDEVTISGFSGGWVAWSQEDHVGVLMVKETTEHFAFDLETGKFLWGPTEPTHYLDAIDDSAADVRNIAYGKLYVASVGGIAYCYDVKTGELLWTYEAKQKYTEYLFQDTWWLKPVFITDDKIYLGHTEHSPMNPRPRGAPFICLNATTGEEIWTADGLFRQTRWGGRGIIGDSIMVTMDTYDQRVYAVGKGPSALTVTAPNMGVPSGSSLMISGTVMDVSPGTKDLAITMRFPNGVPAVSDESQSEWMLHVYKQFELPMSTVGVPVTIDVLDANGNYRNVGTAISDATGAYNLEWKPDIPGKYTVIASFAGTNSYYPSCAQTAFVVDAAAEPTTQPTAPPALLSETYFLPAIAGIIVAIIIGFALMALLLLRKRP